ncbi:MAG: MraY family glycosyltransferase [Candidatus Berkelbacteria bacterium]
MIQNYIAPLVIAALMTGGLTYSVKVLAEKLGIFDEPGGRKIHEKATPRLGGLAIVLAFLLTTIGYALAANRLDFGSAKILIFDQKLIGVLFGAVVLLVVGIVDDVSGVKPWWKLFWHIVAATIVVSFGLNIGYIRLPAGLHIDLGNLIWNYSLFGIPFHFTVWSNLLTVFWIVLMINTLNFLDGLDGLAGGIAVIAAVSIFFLSLSLGQPAAALLSLIFAGSVLGFIPWNFNPAKIFMGDSGSMFLGYLLGVLAVISGGKVATAFLVLGIPVLDVVWVALRRIMSGNSPFKADKFHLHHRLIDVGLTQRQAVLTLYLISAIFGAVAIFSQTAGKVQATVWLLIVMGTLAIGLIVLEWRKRKRGKNV